MHLQGDIGVFQQFDPAVRHAGKLAGMIVKADMNNVCKLGRIADVGLAVGLAVGAEVGLMLGAAVGATVGLEVGMAVGLAVGIAVGE